MTYLVSFNVTDDVYEPVAIGVTLEDAAQIVSATPENQIVRDLVHIGEAFVGRYHITLAPDGIERWVSPFHPACKGVLA